MKPASLNRLSVISRMDSDPRGRRGFGNTCVNGLSRSPSPPAMMTAFILRTCQLCSLGCFVLSSLLFV